MMMFTPPQVHEHTENIARTASHMPQPLKDAIIEGMASQAESLLNEAKGTELYYHSFIHVAEVLLRAKGAALPKRRAEGLLATARYFNRFGNPFMAIYYAQPALKFAIEAAQPKLEREANNMLALLNTKTENLPRAFEYLDQSLQLARFLKDSLAECEIWVSISSAFEQAGMHREAIRAAEHAYYLGWTNDMNPKARDYRIGANANIMLSALSLGDIQRGMTAVELALKDLPIASINPMQRLILENNIIRLLLASGKLDEAEQRAAQARDIAAPLQSIRATLQADIATGLCEVYRGGQSVEKLLKVYDQAKTQYRPAYTDALRALIVAHEKTGQPKQAVHYVQELVDHLGKAKTDCIVNHAQMMRAKLAQETGVDIPVEAELTDGLQHLHNIAAALRLQVVEADLKDAVENLLEDFAVSAELIDDETGDHCYRVGRLTFLLAEAFGCDEHTAQTLEIAARLHDVGKAGISHNVLKKPSALNPEERLVMQTHSNLGAELLEKFDSPTLQMAAEIARHHHEWWNGEGYPHKLKGEAIPMAARLTALADVFDALTHKRVYKEAWSVSDALAEIKQLKGKQFDPELTDLFTGMVQRLTEQHGAQLDSYLAQSAKRSTFLQARRNILEELEKVA